MSASLILLTGATGWLGQNLLRALTAGLEGCGEWNPARRRVRVRCLVPKDQDISDLECQAPEVEFVRGDLRSPHDCRLFCHQGREAIVLHTAGVIHPRRVADFYAINVDGTRHLLEAAADAGVRRVVAVSSNSVCGCNPHHDHLFDEESPLHPYMHYGRSKMLMETLLDKAQQRLDLETVIIRCPWFYGPNQPPRQALFFRMIRDGKVPLVGDGHNRRSMAYTDNLCQGILRAAWIDEAAGQRYWIADERPYAMTEIIDTVERLLLDEFGQRCARRRIRLPALVSDLAYLADRCLQGVGLYQQKIHVLSEMSRTIACSVAKAERELGYVPTIDLEEGMRRSLHWAFAHGQMT